MSRPRSRSPTSRSVVAGGVLGRALHQRQRMLRALQVDAERHDAARLGEVHPVDHQRDQVQSAQVGAEQPSQSGLGLRRELPRHRRPAGGCRDLTDLLPDRFQADLVAAGRQPSEHPVHRHPAEDLGAAEQLIGRHRQLAAAVHRADPRPLHRNAATAQGDRSARVAVPDRDPVAVVLALHAGQRGHVGVHHRAHHLEPGADREGQQALAHVPGDLGHRHSDVLRHGQPVRVRCNGHLLLILLVHGGPLLSLSVFGGRPTPTARQELSGGPPPQVLRDPGHPRLWDRGWHRERLRSPAGAATPPVMRSTAGRTRGVSAHRSPRRVVAGEDVTARGDTGCSSASQCF